MEEEKEIKKELTQLQVELCQLGIEIEERKKSVQIVRKLYSKIRGKYDKLDRKLTKINGREKIIPAGASGRKKPLKFTREQVNEIASQLGVNMEEIMRGE